MGNENIKEKAVAAYKSRGSKTRKDIAREFGVSESALQHWIYGPRNRKRSGDAKVKNKHIGSTLDVRRMAETGEVAPVKEDERQLPLPFEIDSMTSARLSELRRENAELRKAIEDTYDVMVDATRKLLSVVLNSPREK